MSSYFEPDRPPAAVCRRVSHNGVVYPSRLWNIFCEVIDNFGDVGVCWRLGCGLAARGERVCLWLSDTAALRWLAPQGAPGVVVRPWAEAASVIPAHTGDVLVETFGCRAAPEFIAAYASHISATSQKCLWLNLEYLSAEPYVRRSHRLPSPVLHGAGSGLTKHFFYPGFTPGTGGLLREADLLARLSTFVPERWLVQHGIQPAGRQLVSLFCYEPPRLGALLWQLANAARRSLLLVTPGRASAAVQACLAADSALQAKCDGLGTLSILHLPWLDQRDFDHLLWSCDMNFVRGEDSLVRALWAGRALVWQLYPQSDGAHLAKLEAWLDWIGADAGFSAWHRNWNATTPGDLPALEVPRWGRAVQAAREGLLKEPDLVSQLLRFVSENR